MDKHSLNPRVPSIKSVKFDFDSFNDIYFKRFIAGFMILVIIGLGFTGYKINEVRTRGYEVFIGDTSLGYIRDEKIALALMNEFNDTLTDTYNSEVMFEEEMSFKTMNVKDDSLVSATELNRNIRSEANFLVSAFTISIDGEEIGIVRSEEEAKEVFNEIKAPYVSSPDEDAIVTEAEFLEDVEITNSYIEVDDIEEKDEIVESIRTGGEGIDTHTVEAGESYWVIAQAYNISVDDLIEANPGIEEKGLRPGDTITVSTTEPKATVVTTEEIVTTENIDYEVIVEYSDDLYEDEETIKVEGQPGTAEIIIHQTKHDGDLADSEIKSKRTVEEPVNQVVIQGTKERPKTVATGSFQVPTVGRITSGYGMRWGRMHRGLDIAAPIGTPIHAADGGIVTYAGTQGSYGNMVEVDHENGYKTRYAHVSKMHVSVGTRVYKGQQVADIGNTGRSTGPHLHFEVLENGVQKDPSGYIY